MGTGQKFRAYTHLGRLVQKRADDNEARRFYKRDTTPGANRRWRLEKKWKVGYKKMTNYIETPLGEVFLPENCTIEGTLLMDFSKLSPVTRNRIVKAVSCGVLKAVTGDAADITKLLCRSLQLPLACTSNRGWRSRILVLNVPDEDNRTDLKLQTHLYMVAKGDKCEPHIRASEAGFYLFAGGQVKWGDAHGFLSTQMLAYTAEERKSVRTKLAKALEDGPVIKIDLTTGGMKFAYPNRT